MGRENKGGSKVGREEEETLSLFVSSTFFRRFVILKYNSKYQSKRLYIYILRLQAFITPFQLMYSENKKRIWKSGENRVGCKIFMKKAWECGIRKMVIQLKRDNKTSDFSCSHFA